MARLVEALSESPTGEAGWSLPAWVYENPDFLALERERIFLPSWQIVCHLNDISAAGDYVTFELFNELAFVVRGGDGEVRAFHNVCRHRAARLLDGASGNCGGRIRCPYHAWGYDLDGRLAQVPYEETFDGLERADHGLVPVEHEVFMGFVFIRFEGGGPSVAEMMGPVADELALYRLEEMVPLGRVTLRPRHVNWKNVGDNYSDGMHIPVAHGGLTRLFGNSYTVEAVGGVHRLSGRLRDKPSARWSERAYQAWLPEVAHLPPERRRLWYYVKFFPNFVFDIYPDQIDFMQWIPVSPTETLVREIPYGLPDERREMRLARYLNWRINRRVSAEDKELIDRVQAGMASGSYVSGPLSRDEVCLRDFAETMRRRLPFCREPTPPTSEALRSALGQGARG
jgi:phenylpropionate dioxygenase-like ring-hydroxylating dioxygenase large terminal subunit